MNNTVVCIFMWSCIACFLCHVLDTVHPAGVVQGVLYLDNKLSSNVERYIKDIHAYCLFVTPTFMTGLFCVCCRAVEKAISSAVSEHMFGDLSSEEDTTSDGKFHVSHSAMINAIYVGLVAPWKKNPS